jgi:hypothetical protein
MQFSGEGALQGGIGGAAAGAAIGLMGGPIGFLVGAPLGALAGSVFLGQKNKSPSFNPQQSLAYQQQEFNQMAPQALSFGNQSFQQAAANSLAYSTPFTQKNIDLQNLVTPGSSAQREAALQQINAYIQGQVPQDVQQNTQRAIAQSFGGGYNPFTGGGQAPSAFARNIGQTSVGLSQYGLSAAPTWQQLANSMVTRPDQLLGAALAANAQGVSMATGAAQYGSDLGQSSYNSAMNQYGAQTAQNQAGIQNMMSLGSLGLSAYGALQNANYLNSLSPSMQGRLATVGAIPAYTNTPYLNSQGYSAGETPSMGTGA